LAKDGHGKGNWGNVDDDVKALGEEETKEGAEEGKEEKSHKREHEGVKAEEVFADVKEEEETGTTLADFLAQKKTVGFKKEARKAEENKKTNIEKGAEKVKVATIESKLKDQETYSISTGQSEFNNLLGF